MEARFGSPRLAGRSGAAARHRDHDRVPAAWRAGSPRLAGWQL